MNPLSDALTFGDVVRGQASVRPEKIAFQTLDGRSVSFGDFNRRVNRLNNAVAQLGLAKGARVAILSRNRPEYVEAYGLSKSGFIVVPLNWRLAASELAKLIQHSAPELLIVDQYHRELVDGIKGILPAGIHCVLLDEARPGWASYEEILAAAPTSEPVSIAQASDVLCLIYTSGTTGAPKGVAVTHAAALGNCRTSAIEMLQLQEHDMTMAVMPLFHAGGMWYHLFPSFATGCTTLVLPEFEPGIVLKELEARRITNVHLVPTMISALLAHPAAASADLSCIRLLFYAASSMPPDLLRRAMQTFPRCGFAQAYGSTEAGVVTVLDPRAHERAQLPEGEHLLASCGRAFSGHEVRLVDDAQREVGQGAIGEIEVRSPDLMQGYWLNEEATRAALVGGWLKTGDLGHFDAEGYLYIVDRKNDMVVTGGENVFPTEVEAHLYRDPDILEAAVFGVPDPQWVEKVVAAVVLKPGASVSGDELIKRLRGQLAAYKCPKTIYFTSTLPKSAVGKILRKELRKEYGSPN
jgi:acyl-CoA synthetase (AMP-forming)/AMP-acid ligase II